MKTAATILEEQPHLKDYELCLVTWVYEDDGDGNHEFGDITRSYCSRALLSKDEQRAIKKMLEPHYEAGTIMDVYVGPESNKASTFLTEMALIGQCLPELEDS